MSTPYILIFITILLNSVAQLLLKAGMERIGHFDLSVSNLWPIGLQVATNVPVMSGIACYVLSVALWLVVLARVEVSVAFPMMSLCYLITAPAAWLLFGEALTPTRMAGILVIILGVFLVSKTA